MKREAYEGTERRSHSEPWHLDRKVTLAMILAILIQAGAGVFAAGQILRDVDDSKQGLAKLQAEQNKMAILSERVVRVETLVEGVKSTVDRIEQKIERR